MNESVRAGKPAITTATLCCVLLIITIFIEILDFPAALASSCALEVTNPVLKSPSSRVLDEATAGEQFVIATTITSCIEEEVPFFAIFEVRNSDGTTESLNWQSGILRGLNDQYEVGVSWVPLQGGDYELRTFVLSDIENPQILSTVRSQDITIATNSDRAVIAIPNDPDPSLQEVNFEPSFIKVIIGVNNTVKWTNGDTVSHKIVGESGVNNPVDFGHTVLLYPGYSFEYTFNEAGEFRYVDRDREWMRGVVWVIPRDALSAHLEFEVDELKDVYRLGQEPVEFTVDIKGFETGCGRFEMFVERTNVLPNEQLFGYSHAAFFDCLNVAAPYNDFNYHFPWPEEAIAYEIPINQTGTYRATVSFVADYTSFHYSLTKEFRVVE